MLRAAFVRVVGERDRIYVTRSDGSEVSWPFPTYGDGLPHDLVHVVVESAFEVSRGFWGRVDAGADPKVINAQANRTGGADKYADFGTDQSELPLAEALANAPWSAAPAQVIESVREACRQAGVTPPKSLSRERVEQTQQTLIGLARRWRELRPKGRST